ncbi:glycosyltransferase family 4 protein [Candidatus Woesearchaeota archaeon]|nr:glycosyltransferase family 4 protein [Candidatus Woesearchaeota archaeon]
MNVVFLYNDPHAVHDAWAKSIDAKFLSFAPEWTKNNGIIMHAIAILKGLIMPKADVYLIESPMMATALLIPSFFRKFNIVAINSDPFFIARKSFNTITKKIFDTACKRIDAYVSTSKIMDENIPWNKKRTIVPPFADIQRFEKITPANNSDICFIGPHLNINKGTDRLVALFRTVKKTLNNKLYLVGELQPELEWIKKEKDVTVTGRMKSPEQILNKCGIYANMARLEPAGVNIIEAMAAGFTPIVTEMCGFKEEVRKISPELVINTPEQAIKAIDFVIQHQQELGHKSARIAKEFSKEKIVQKFKKAFAYALKP